MDGLVGLLDAFIKTRQRVHFIVNQPLNRVSKRLFYSNENEIITEPMNCRRFSLRRDEGVRSCVNVNPVSYSSGVSFRSNGTIWNIFICQR